MHGPSPRPAASSASGPSRPISPTWWLMPTALRAWSTSRASTHVGLGTDLLGLVGASAIANCNELPQLAAALSGKFFSEETAKLLGGNYRRVFQASLGG